MVAFKSEVQTHVSLLRQISDSVSLKYKEIMADTKNYAFRQKRGILNGIGTIWKSITGNLDASDGEYFNDCINKVTRDEQQIENLLKNQISVTTSVIKNFNNTIQKLQINEKTFNQDIDKIQKSLLDITDNIAFYEAKLQIVYLCETLMESYLFIENFLNDILNAISFAQLKVLHSSIIAPTDLLDSLKQISQSLHKNNLPLPIYSTNIAKYIDLIELEAYQSDTKVVFVLKIPLTNPETYTLYKLYPIPVLDDRTGLHHIPSISQRYVARDDDSILYTSFTDLKICKPISRNEKICSGILPYPIDNDAICEAQLLRQSINLPRTCQMLLVFTKEYNVQEVDQNLWLITVSDPLPITIKCTSKDIVSKIIKTNSILHLQPDCSAFIGTTRVRANYLVDAHPEITYKNYPVIIPYKCCNHLPEKIDVPDLKPLKLNKIDTEDLGIAQHKLKQYSDELDKLINQPFITKQLPWFTILTVILVICLIILYIFCKCRKGRSRIIMSRNDDHPPSPPPVRFTRRNSWRRILPRRRPSLRLQEPIEVEDIEPDVKVAA